MVFLYEAAGNLYHHHDFGYTSPALCCRGVVAKGDPTLDCTWLGYRTNVIHPTVNFPRAPRSLGFLVITVNYVGGSYKGKIEVAFCFACFRKPIQRSPRPQQTRRDFAAGSLARSLARLLFRRRGSGGGAASKDSGH
ncbi:hypothetical protein BHE74_00040339 [Ensete ventricosum]|nr:hypothetical protein GW17_00040955 [Ensete ventricosum]RWW53193.1 hypothetical protein BHE74_00040339 [Ensete ventricosum]